MSLELHNPHSILAALQTRPAEVAEVRLPLRSPHGTWGDVAALAAACGVRVRRAASEKPAGRSLGGGRSSVSSATVKPRPGVGLDELFSDAHTRAEGRGLWLALDSLQDPHNVGAIFRSAAFFGIEGIVVTTDRSAPLSATVYDVASGGMEYVPFSLQHNLARALEQSKSAGVWVLGASERAERDVARIDRHRPWLLVIGNEEHGLRRLTLETCDELCRVTPRGPIRSLNAATAAAVLMAVLTARPG